MIEPPVRPKDAEHVARLAAFARDVLDVCDREGARSVLDGVIAVLAYAGDPSVDVHGIAFPCSGLHFPRLCRALESIGIECGVRR